MPGMVFPSCTSQGRIMNTAATRPMAKAMALFRVIFSLVNRWAITMVNRGFRQMMDAAVAALHRSTPSWKQSMLMGIPMMPTRQIQPMSPLVMGSSFFRSSVIPKGNRMIPPMRNRRKVSWMESRSLPPVLRATSMVLNRNAVKQI